MLGRKKVFSKGQGQTHCRVEACGEIQSSWVRLMVRLGVCGDAREVWDERPKLYGTFAAQHGSVPCRGHKIVDTAWLDLNTLECESCPSLRNLQ